MYTAQRIGETKVKVIDGVKSTEDLNVLLRIGWGAETTNRMSFKPADDLGVGDELSVTLEKLVKVVEEPKPEAAIKAAETTGGTGVQETAQAAPESKSEAPCAAEPAAETVAGEKKEAEPQPAEGVASAAAVEAGVENPCSCACAAEPAAEAPAEEKEAEPPVDKIGEVEGVVASNVSQENNPRFLFRVIYTKKTEEGPITLQESLKPNDRIRVTIIRTLKAPEPEAAEGAALAQG